MDESEWKNVREPPGVCWATHDRDEIQDAAAECNQREEEFDRPSSCHYLRERYSQERVSRKLIESTVTLQLGRVASLRAAFVIYRP
jgi:hypothetical protein